MKITPIAAPMPVTSQTSSGPSPSVREAAIAKYMGTAPQTQVPPPQHAVDTPLNANNISPEDLSGLKPRIPEEVVAQEASQEQDDTNKSSDIPAQATSKEEQDNKYQLLARQARIQRQRARDQEQREQTIKTKEEAIRARELLLESKAKEYDTGYIPKTNLKQAALDAIMSGELPYEEVTEQVLNQERVDPRLLKHIKSLEEKLQALERNTEEQKTASIKAQEESYQAAVRQIDYDVKDLVRSNPDDFELIIKTNSHRDVTRLIEDTFKKGLLKPAPKHNADWEFPPGSIIPSDRAARIVEDYLTDETLKLYDSKKIRQRTSQPKAMGAKPQQEQVKPQPQPMKTLTNAVGSSRQLSIKERAILAFKGELKA